MNTKLFKTSLFWGFVLRLIGYILGIVLFAFVPASILGWVIMPIGILVTLFVLIKKIQFKSLHEYVLLGIIWLIIAVLCDYFFLVKVFNPPDGYYKLDVYLYYLLTLTLPIIVGLKRAKNNR